MNVTYQKTNSETHVFKWNPNYYSTLDMHLYNYIIYLLLSPCFYSLLGKAILMKLLSIFRTADRRAAVFFCGSNFIQCIWVWCIWIKNIVTRLPASRPNIFCSLKYKRHQWRSCECCLSDKVIQLPAKVCEGMRLMVGVLVTVQLCVWPGYVWLVSENEISEY